MGWLTIIKITCSLLRFLILPPLILYPMVEIWGCERGTGSIYEVQRRVRRKVVRRPKNIAKGTAEWELGNECRRGKRLCT
jgi:hypothetical protein